MVREHDDASLGLGGADDGCEPVEVGLVGGSVRCGVRASMRLKSVSDRVRKSRWSELSADQRVQPRMERVGLRS